MHIDQPNVVGQQHAHDRLRGVRAENPSFESRFLSQVRQARRVIQVEVRHQEEVDLIGRKRRGRCTRSGQNSAKV